jgi:hypothetical protein
MDEKKQNKTKKNKSENSGSDTEKFNLLLLESERKRMVKLQSKCVRDRRACNLSEILRAGIGALELLSEEDIEKVVKNLKNL